LGEDQKSKVFHIGGDGDWHGRLDDINIGPLTVSYTGISTR
jgi:hypothetical protein